MAPECGRARFALANLGSASFIERVRRTGRRLLRRLSRRAVILLYHRIAAIRPDPYRLAVQPQHFAEQLEVLRKRAHPIPLASLATALRRGSLPPRAIVVTFDDGYADNLYHAKPLLERTDVPATAFVTSGDLDRMREFWWDRLERILLDTPRLPDELSLRISGESRAWSLDLTTAAYGSVNAELHRSWSLEDGGTQTPRHALFRELYALLRGSSHDERESTLAHLQLWAGSTDAPRASHRALLGEELLRLADGELVEIGAHTVTHPALASLPLEAQRAEIVGSKNQLEHILGRRVTSFSYTHGSRNTETVRAVREAGFLCACSSTPAAVWSGADIYQLPRIEVRDCDGDTFEQRLRDWLGR